MVEGRIGFRLGLVGSMEVSTKIVVQECVCVYVLQLQHAEYQSSDSTYKGRTFLGGEDILAGPHTLDCGVKHGFKVGMGLGLVPGQGVSWHGWG